MPIVRIAYSTPAAEPAGIRARIAEAARTLTVDVLRKKPELIAVTVERVAPQDWFVAGTSLAEAGKASFWLEIKITDGTNGKDEKAAFVAAVFAAMARLIGPLHAESYVHVHDVRAEAYGYGGRTQEWRYVAAQIEADGRTELVDAAYRRWGVR